MIAPGRPGGWLLAVALTAAAARGQSPPAADPPAVEAVPSPAEPKADPLRFESADKFFTAKIGGRFQFDTANYAAPRGLRANVPGSNRLEDGVTFRRIRLDAAGTVGRNMEYYARSTSSTGCCCPTAGRPTSPTRRTCG